MTDKPPNPRTVQETSELRFYVLDAEQFDIAPAERKRDWMDDTEGHAYRCLPLSIANSHGWVLCCVEAFEAEWNGSDNEKGVKLYPKQALGEDLRTVSSHFGYGTITFEIRAIVRTPPGYNLWISGMPNQFKDGIQALSALVECDWIPYTFTMNWKFTRPNHRIRFDVGEPFAFIFPVPRGTLQSMQPVLLDLIDNPELLERNKKASAWRCFEAYIRERKPEHDPTLGWYMRGLIPINDGFFKEHEKTIKLKPLIDLRRHAKADD